MRSVQKTTFKCSFCASTKMKKIIDFGEVALAGAFFKTKEFSNEKKYPHVFIFATTVLLFKLWI
jgi:hypothetical protein